MHSTRLFSSVSAALAGLALLAACPAPPAAEQERAKNVILFLADGGGIPTVDAASIYGHGETRSLYVQNMPHIGLNDTSSASSWVSDSANGMTAIVTGQRTHNGVISQDASAVRGEKDGQPLKTILEHAEERGLSTGVISNSSMADATPAACYSHSNDRAKHGEIFLQIFEPRFGDGVDLVVGYGRSDILEKTAELGADLPSLFAEHGFAFLDSVDELAGAGSDTKKVAALFDDAEFDLAKAVEHAIRILSANPNGFFLMVESNTHGGDAKRNLERMVTFDKIIGDTARKLKEDTLILFTADHSHDQRLQRGMKGEDILPHIRVEGGAHTAEEVLVAAEGPGAGQIRGYLPNTKLFEVMMAAYGWE